MVLSARVIAAIYWRSRWAKSRFRGRLRAVLAPLLIRPAKSCRFVYPAYAGRRIITLSIRVG